MMGCGFSKVDNTNVTHAEVGTESPPTENTRAQPAQPTRTSDVRFNALRPRRSSASDETETSPINAGTGEAGARHLLVFSAPGGSAFGSALSASMKSNIEASGRQCNVFLHDGPDSTSGDTLAPFMDALKNDSSSRPSLLIASHGDVKGGQHHINLDGQYTPTSEFFDRISANARGPVDIFLTACHGGAALTDAKHLPPGSSVAVIAPGTETVSSRGVEALAANVGKSQSLDAKHVLLTYCTTLVNRFPPSLWQGGKTYSLDSMMKARLGRPFREEEKQQAKEKLRGLLSPQRIDELVGKMESARDEWSIYAVDYGPALAVTGAIDLPSTSRQGSVFQGLRV
jgi:hypothetical protein